MRVLTKQEQIAEQVRALSPARKERRAAARKKKRTKVKDSGPPIVSESTGVFYKGRPKKVKVGHKPTKAMLRKNSVKQLKKYGEYLLSKAKAGDITSVEYYHMIHRVAAQIKVLRDARSEYPAVSNKTRRVVECRNVTAKKAGCDRKAKHHSHKVYISPAERACNKAADGKPTFAIKPESKRPVPVVVGSTPAPLNVPRKNSVPVSRKAKLKADYVQRALIKELRASVVQEVSNAA